MVFIRVKDLMISLDKYAVVSEEASFHEAILALGKARAGADEEDDRPRAVLVANKDGRIVGKLDSWDLLKGLEPRYNKVGYARELSSSDCSGEHAGSILKTYGLWRDVLDEVCEIAPRMSVKDTMHILNEREYIEAEVCIEEAMNRMVVYNLTSLIVTQEGEARGILRLIDVLKLIVERISTCQVYPEIEQESADSSLAA